MLKEVAFRLIEEVEPIFVKLATANHEEFIRSVVDLVHSLPLPDYVSEIKGLTDELAKMRQGKVVLQPGETLMDNMAPLSTKRRELLDKLMGNEEVRVFKKVSEFILERAIDVLKRENMDDSEVEYRAQILDAALSEVGQRSTASESPQVEETTVGVKFANKRLGRPQTELQHKLSVSAKLFNGKGPGIVVKE